MKSVFFFRKLLQLRSNFTNELLISGSKATLRKPSRRNWGSNRARDGIVIYAAPRGPRWGWPNCTEILHLPTATANTACKPIDNPHLSVCLLISCSLMVIRRKWFFISILFFRFWRECWKNYCSLNSINPLVFHRIVVYHIKKPSR